MTIDDYLPLFQTKEGLKLLSAHCVDPNEIWVPRKSGKIIISEKGKKNNDKIKNQKKINEINGFFFFNPKKGKETKKFRTQERDCESWA